MLAKITLEIFTPKDSLFCTSCNYKNENDFCKIFHEWLQPHDSEDNCYRSQECLNAEKS